MQKINSLRTALLGCAAVAILGACSGADGVASPGVGAFVPAPSTPAPTTPPPPTGPAPGTPAADCPAGFSNVGTVANSRVCQLPSTITGNLVVPQRAGTVYSVSGRTQVGNDTGPNPASPLPGRTDGILTIEPGVTIFGNSGLDYLMVNRGSQIFAEGTETNPIIMTSRQGVEGTADENSIGQWGGVIINGRAPTTSCPGGTTPPNIACEAQVEGSNAFYGGLSAGDNSGRLRYVRVSYSGFRIAPNNELNGITFAGVGSGTVAEYIQVHNSSDDGIEIFGGNVNLRYLVLTGNDDDSFDTDTGWRGAAQFGIVYQRAGGGNNGFETSSAGTNTATYFTRPTYSNWTIVLRSTTGVGDAILHNSGHVGRVFNSVLRSEVNAQCLNIAQQVTLDNPNGAGIAGAPNGPIYNSVFFSCNGGNTQAGANPATDLTPPVTLQQVNDQVALGSNNVLSGTSTLTGGFINGANENAVPATAFLAALNGTDAALPPGQITTFLTPVSYIGAVQNAADDWYAGWTCSLPGQSAC